MRRKIKLSASWWEIDSHLRIQGESVKERRERRQEEEELIRLAGLTGKRFRSEIDANAAIAKAGLDPDRFLAIETASLF